MEYKNVRNKFENNFVSLQSGLSRLEKCHTT